MAALTPQIKTFIVQALACFDTPSQVAEAVKGQYGLVVSRQQVEMHDPTKRCSKGLARRWVVLFEDTRGAFREAMADIPLANRAYRLKVLDRMLVKAEAAGNLVLAMSLLDQAAREVGREPRRRHSKGSAPLAVEAGYAAEYRLQ